jgi:hypothetical protein
MHTDSLAFGEGSVRPAVAVIGFDPEVAEEIGHLVDAVTAFDSLEAFVADQSSFDMAVVTGSVEIDDDSLYLLIVGDTIHDGRNGVGRVSSLAQVEAKALRPAEDIPEAFATAAHGLCTDIGSAWLSGLTFTDYSVARPIVVNGETTIAALYDRGRGVGLAVPARADVVEWFRAFCEHVHQLDESVVPIPPPKVARPAEWQTAHELEAAAQLERIESEIAELMQWRDEARESLVAARSDAELGERWMLWATDDDLVGSVRMSLEDLGLQVQEVDEEGREQLRVTSQDLPDWLALVDVASFDASPTMSDLKLLNQHRMAYIAEQGDQPSQIWWVVNDHHTLDPSHRPNTLSELSTAAELVDVVAMSTRDLFRLGRDAAMERIDLATARKLLTEAAPGVLSYMSDVELEVDRSAEARSDDAGGSASDAPEPV